MSNPRNDASGARVDEVDVPAIDSGQKPRSQRRFFEEARSVAGHDEL